MRVALSLSALGWRACYAQQLTLHDLESALPARVAEVHRNRIVVLHEAGESNVTLPGNPDAGDAPAITVGDWALIERDAPRIVRVLERASLIARIAAGTETRLQPIAANLDTLFVVTSCNDDFNASRLERYLSIAFEAHVEPVILLTKADLCAGTDPYIEQTARLVPRANVIAMNALDGGAVTQLAPWLDAGQSVAFVGSSGVGKSTVVNTLSGASRATAGIREDDAKGRHTTTSRQLVAMPGGAWLIDTPGMRELRIGAATSGVSVVFDDVETLARSCRYRDCSHQEDDGCALRHAVENGQIDERRVKSYLKLQLEAANAARTLHEKRERERQFGRQYKAVQDLQRREKQGR